MDPIAILDSAATDWGREPTTQLKPSSVEQENADTSRKQPEELHERPDESHVLHHSPSAKHIGLAALHLQPACASTQPVWRIGLAPRFYHTGAHRDRLARSTSLPNLGEAHQQQFEAFEHSDENYGSRMEHMDQALLKSQFASSAGCSPISGQHLEQSVAEDHARQDHKQNERMLLGLLASISGSAANKQDAALMGRGHYVRKRFDMDDTAEYHVRLDELERTCDELRTTNLALHIAIARAK